MKNLLILAYYFPPLAMGGTQRIAKFVKYLPEYGWQPHVVTVKDIAYYATDETLMKDVQEANIFRTGSLDPQRVAVRFSGRSGHQTGASNPGISATLMKIFSFFFIPDTKLLWLPFAYRKAKQAIEACQADAILTTSPPHSIHLAGLRLKRKLGIPWLADFRDRWSGGHFQAEATPFHRALNRRWERKIVTSADFITAVSPGLVNHLKAVSGEDSGKFEVITNGYDADDFRHSALSEPFKKFTIAYCGTISQVSPLDSFLTAVEQWLTQDPELRSKIVTTLVGYDLKGDLKEQIKKLGLDDVVEITGYVNHGAAIDHLRKADLLLYSVSKRATQDFIPGKTFEYIASGKPVLALGPEIDGTEILRKYTDTTCCNHENVDEIVQALSDLYANGKAKRPENLHPDFDRRNLTGRLASLLDSIL